MRKLLLTPIAYILVKLFDCEYITLPAHTTN